MASIKLYLDADITAGPFLASTLREHRFDVVSAVDVGNADLRQVFSPSPLGLESPLQD